MNTVAVTINLPTAGTRQDYLHCVASALTAAQAAGDTNSAMALCGLLTLVDEALSWSQKVQPHFYLPGMGKDGRVRRRLILSPLHDHKTLFLKPYA